MKSGRNQNETGKEKVEKKRAKNSYLNLLSDQLGGDN